MKQQMKTLAQLRAERTAFMKTLDDENDQAVVKLAKRFWLMLPQPVDEETFVICAQELGSFVRKTYVDAQECVEKVYGPAR
jgi:hypothetical protein